MIHAASDIPNDVLTSILSSSEFPARKRTAAYDWRPDEFMCTLYYEVLMAVLEHTLPRSFPDVHLEAFCSAASAAHSVSTFTQYGRGLMKLFSMIESYESKLGCTASLLPLSLSFALFYVAERFMDCSANGDSIKKEFAGLSFLHTQLGFTDVIHSPLFDSAFAGFNRGLTPFADLVNRRGYHPSTVRLVIDIALSPESTSSVIEACTLLLISYLFWFRPVSFMALSWEHFTLLPEFALEVTETERKATGSSAAKRALSRTKIVKRKWSFAEGSVFESCLLRFLDVSIPRMTATKSPLFAYASESQMNTAIQTVLEPVLSMQQTFGSPAEYTVYSGRIGGLTAAKQLGSTNELINVWGGWVQGGTSWAPYLRPDILFKDNRADVNFAKACFSHLLPVT